ncbi:protein zyg-11 homolog B-like [Tachypleus tridentatus]|uniref:protein zyg-11 homolog B-like n=1 Tax=Tachypleus tridentatus TaxID=6853 RepID=UPI003FD3B587
MYDDNPLSLQEYCVNYISENIDAICEVQTNLDDSTSRYVFKAQDTFCPSKVSEQLLETLDQRGFLTDDLLTLFTSNVTRLEHVHIHNSPSITTKGLRVLRSHKITELEATGLMKITVNNLIGCLGDWSLRHLRLLNVANSIFTSSGKICVVVALSKLQNLLTLNVSNTEFNSHGLEIVTEDLQLLENLDISNTKVEDITPLRRCKDRLKSLAMYNLRKISNNDVVSVLCELNHLRYLDVSEDKDHQALDMQDPLKYRVSDLLRQTKCLPHISSLDISGKEGIYMDRLRAFLLSHPKMTFLGLVQTDVCFNEMFTRESSEFYNPNLVVTGSAKESQILEALRRYPLRPLYIQKSLYYLYSYTQRYSEPRTDVIKLILPGMRKHPRVLAIQMAATACLYNLSKGNLGQKIHPRWLGEIVDLTLTAMENYPTHQQLQKNTLLTLCSDRILQDVSFDKYRCAKLVMESLVAFDDPSMNRMSVAICSILAAKISTAETSCLGAKPSFMERLLNIVQSKMDEPEVDIMMKFTLSALWNLTDESPSTCAVFLDMKGLDLFLKVLKKFQGQSAVETKVLGLVNNIAEVAHLRQDLMVEDFLNVLRLLLHSRHIDVSYFAAGIVAHLASDGPSAWIVTSVPREVMLKELGDVVSHWQQPDGEMVAYRSFHPFFPLLTCIQSFEVQLWAVWAIHHVCSKNPKRYCPMLLEEGGTSLLEKLLCHPKTSGTVATIAQAILLIVNEHMPVG